MNQPEERVISPEEIDATFNYVDPEAEAKEKDKEKEEKSKETEVTEEKEKETTSEEDESSEEKGEEGTQESEDEGSESEKSEKEGEGQESTDQSGLEAQNQFLRDELIRLTSAPKVPESTEKETEGETGKGKETQESEKVKEKVSETLGEGFRVDLDLYKSIVDADEPEEGLEKFNAFINKLVIHTVEKAREGELKRLSPLVNSAISSRITYQEINKEYYAANPELKPFVPVQKRYAEELALKEPAKYPQTVEGLRLLLKDSGELTKKLLPQSKAKENTETGGGEGTKKPAFAGGSGETKGSGKDLTDFDKHLVEMFPVQQP